MRIFISQALFSALFLKASKPKLYSKENHRNMHLCNLFLGWFLSCTNHEWKICLSVFLLLESWIKDDIQLFRSCLDVSSYGVKRLMNLSWDTQKQLYQFQSLFLYQTLSFYLLGFLFCFSLEIKNTSVYFTACFCQATSCRTTLRCCLKVEKHERLNFSLCKHILSN